MTQKIERSEIIDYQTYEEQRSAVQERMFEIKEPRRVHLGDNLTFLFENHETMRYQIQEMIRVERIVKESSILHEIETYNELLGDEGELACTLLIEIDDRAERIEKLEAWLDLPRHLYLKLDDGERAYAEYDAGQVGDDRLSAVQYLKFKIGGRAPVGVGADLPVLTLETDLSPETRRALMEDLGI